MFGRRRERRQEAAGRGPERQRAHGGGREPAVPGLLRRLLRTRTGVWEIKASSEVITAPFPVLVCVCTEPPPLLSSSPQVLLAMHANVEDRGIKGDITPLMAARKSVAEGTGVHLGGRRSITQKNRYA